MVLTAIPNLHTVPGTDHKDVLLLVASHLDLFQPSNRLADCRPEQTTLSEPLCNLSTSNLIVSRPRSPPLSSHCVLCSRRFTTTASVATVPDYSTFALSLYQSYPFPNSFFHCLQVSSITVRTRPRVSKGGQLHLELDFNHHNYPTTRGAGEGHSSLAVVLPSANVHHFKACDTL